MAEMNDKVKKMIMKALRETSRLLQTFLKRCEVLSQCAVEKIMKEMKQRNGKEKEERHLGSDKPLKDSQEKKEKKEGKETVLPPPKPK